MLPAAGEVMHKNEVGAAICRFPSGKIGFGPWTEGCPFHVDIKPSCPTGSKYYGSIHSHVHEGTTPSTEDIAAERGNDGKVACILSPDTLKCYPVRYYS